ncbi:MAG TPA: ATP-binding protein [Thermoleophilaceae bacterium]
MSALALAGWVVAAGAGSRCVALERRASVCARRLDAAGDAEHELRGALTAFALGLDRLARDPLGRRLGRSLRSELERARAALEDLAAARQGEPAPARAEPLALDRLARSAAAAWQPAARGAGRRVQLDWRAGPVRVRADRGRMAQALGNLLSNAVEHGTGPVRVEATRVGARVRVEIVNGLREAGAEPGPGAEAGAEPAAGAVPSGRWLRRAAEARRPDRGRGLRIAARAVEQCGGTLRLSRSGDRASAALELPLAP